jgi:hypothetical protein
MNRHQDDLRSVDLLLEEAEPFLAEALKSLSYPEIFGLREIQPRALEKLRGEIERVEHCVHRANDLSELAWLDDDDLDPEPQAKAAEAGTP